MIKRYSLAEARNQLAKIIDHAEDGVPVELTRRGKPVAVLLTVEDYQRLARAPRPFWDVCQEFREEMSIDQLDIQPDLLIDVRDPSPGRQVDL